MGFLSCGMAKAGFLEEEAQRLETWLSNNSHGEMGYMANHFDKRLDPTKLVEGSKTVISLLYNYFPGEQQNPDSYKISKYAYGKDYHYVIKDKLKELTHHIQTEIGAVHGRAFVDSAPVLEKAWAAKSGLGWVGKNANLLQQKVGSFFSLRNLSLIWIWCMIPPLPIIVGAAPPALMLVLPMLLRLLMWLMVVSVSPISP